MKAKNKNMDMQSSAIRITLVTFAILAIPFIGNQVSSEWDWKFFDFLIIGMLISVTGFFIELVRCKVKDKTSRMLIVAALVIGALLVWAELAVGIFTNLGS